MENDSERFVNPSLGELFDKLTIDQIKQLKRPELHHCFAAEIAAIECDLDTSFAKPGCQLDSELVRLAVALAQVNLHIWHVKEEMFGSAESFPSQMKLAHQINGIRNRLKNRLSELEIGIRGPILSNTSTEDLKGWRFSVLDRPPVGQNNA